MANPRRREVVLFPFMAQGHIIPFLALAQHIQQKGYSITLINTPLNIKNLHKSLSPTSIKLLEIPFKFSDHGIPPDTETADFLSYALVCRFVEATLSLQLPFRKLLSEIIKTGNGEKPVCVISDYFFGWAAEISHEFGIFHAIFSPTGGFGMGCYYSMWMNLPHKQTENDEFLLPDFPEAGNIHITQVTAAMLLAGENEPMTNFHRKNFPTWGKSDGLLLNTVENLDRKGLTYFRRKLGVSVFGIGPLLLPEKDRARNGREATVSAEKCVEWLNGKEERSVIYISFGSQNTISASQMMKMAKALDISGRNFIWVVRQPLGFDITAEFVAEEWLPEDFPARVKEEERGLIISKWAPQIEILAHKSVGAFISHCGWNSVLESLKNGVPILSWPMSADQFYNAKFLAEEVGVCLEMARGTNFEVMQEDIVEKIDMVMGYGNEKGMEIRRKAMEIKDAIVDALRDEEDYKGCSVEAMEEFFSAAYDSERLKTFS